VLVVVTVIQRAVDVRSQLRPAAAGAAPSGADAPTDPPAPDAPGPVAGQ
jgi:hypothetical protein